MLEQRKDECLHAFEDGRTGEVPKKKHPSPISLRLTDEERAQLERDAGDRTLSCYIRYRLFGDPAHPFPSRRPAKKGHKPTADHVMLARLLGVLGQTRLASNLNQIAKAAHIGALPVTEDLEADLRAACVDIREMRDQLMQALGRASR